MCKSSREKNSDSNREKPKAELSGTTSRGDTERRMRIFLRDLHPAGSETPQLSYVGLNLW